MSSKKESAKGSLSSEANPQRKRKHKRLGKSVGCECNLDKEQKDIPKKAIPSSPWYWSNYCKGLLWQHKHELELWKAYAQSLEYEKMQLKKELEIQKELNRQRRQCNKYENETYEASQHQAHFETFEENESEEGKPEEDELEEEAPEEDELEEGENGEDEEIEFEMSEEMIAYFEQSIRRKLELKQLKEEEKKKEEEVEKVEECETNVKDLQEAQELREKEMKLLYGEGSCMIIGMETAVQLSYDKYCDLKSPPYWPNIPLNLTFS